MHRWAIHHRNHHDILDHNVVALDQQRRPLDGIEFALGSAVVTTCSPCDVNSDGSVAINELIAAVNAALGGCIPALLQIPIFFALYSFFNSNILLRGQHFLWSKDLSAYDAIITWKMNLPFIGNHLSLFTILAVVTSLLISIYSMSMTPDQNNPVLKYMPYIFPVIFYGLGVFVAFIQAFVFCLMTMVYISLSTAHDH